MLLDRYVSPEIKDDTSACAWINLTFLVLLAEIACTTPDFSTLCSLVVEAGLDDDLSEGLWTVFAPNDEAFEKADLSDIDDISDVLLFHTVANDKLYLDDLTCSEVRLSYLVLIYSSCVTHVSNSEF